MPKTRNRETGTVFFMVAITLLSKLLGMVRQMMTASIFGASMAGIAFSAASKLPFAIFDMLFSTAILGSFLPIYRGNLLSDKRRASLFSSSFFTFIGILTAAISLLGVIFAKPILHLATPNLDEGALRLGTVLLRIMFPSMIFAGAAYTLVGIMQSHERFLMPAAISAVSNGVILVYLAATMHMANKTSAVIGLAVCYLISWFVQFLFLAVPLFKMHAMPKLTAHLENEDLKTAKRRALPVMFGAWLIPMSTLIANAFSSYIAIGAEKDGAAIVIFENAFSVFSIAGGILTYGICNYLFPKLSAKFASGDEKGFALSVQKGFFVSLAVTLPIGIAVFMLAKEIVGVLYLRGNFTETLAAACAVSLSCLAVSLPAYGMMEFLSRACYSSAKVRYPLYAALIGIVTSFLADLVFALTDTLSVATVGVAFSMGQWMAALLLLVLFQRQHPFEKVKNMGSKVGISAGFLLLFAAVMYLIHTFSKKIFADVSTWTNFLTILLVITPAFVVILGWIILYRKLFFGTDHNRKEGDSRHEKHQNG